jgi:hypothetical protein
MLLKESKIKVLENFYALDYIFFGRPVSEVDTCCPLVKEEYLSIKGALMSVFVEMLRLMEHSPDESSNRVTSKELMAEARAAAQLARNEAERVVALDRSREAIKESVRDAMSGGSNVDISALVETQIRQMGFSLAVDTLMLSGPLAEAASLDELNSWEGEIIEDSYKILRDNLVEAAYDVLYNDDLLAEDDDMEDEGEDEEEEDEEDEMEEGVDFFEALKQRIMEDEKKKVNEKYEDPVWKVAKKETGKDIKGSLNVAIHKCKTMVRDPEKRKKCIAKAKKQYEYVMAKAGGMK